MSRNIEIESKAILTKSDYYKLSEYFSGSKSIIQINHYIDTNDYKILNRNSGLRIRQEDNNFELTLKVKNDVGRLEINQKITAKVFNSFRNCVVFPSGEIKNYIEQILKINTNDLKIFGTLINTRKERRKNGNLFALDCSEYLNKVDYEIECESDSMVKAQKALIDLLSAYSIEYKENRLNKIERVLRAVNH